MEQSKDKAGNVDLFEESASSLNLVSIGDYEAVRDHLMGVIGPGALRAAITIATGKRRVIPIRQSGSEETRD
jgi:hypothetical protein